MNTTTTTDTDLAAAALRHEMQAECARALVEYHAAMATAYRQRRAGNINGARYWEMIAADWAIDTA